MYLKSLTLRGFKSFASATTLNFEPGITCIVGPNGSGKSNVVDALSWVMGEQGAKSLRGGKMEDVIFAGTAGRSALGRAEVSLTIDNTDGALPIDYSEVTISRTMFRSGGSEYAINGHSARLLDVQELLSDSGIGREMHVIVGQGQLDAILSATPETRRGFIEEAAGVLKHRKRKEKALRKLDSTAANLDRLQDLLGEIRRQLKPLGRQAEAARRAATVQAEERDARARLLADDYVMASLALDSDLAAEAALKQQRRDIETALERARDAEVTAEVRLSEAMPAVSRAQEIFYALSALRERTASTRAIAAERVRHAESASTEDRRGRDPEAIEAEADEVHAQEMALQVEREAKAEALRQASTHLAEVEKAREQAEKEYAAAVRAIADRREGLARLTGEVNIVRTRVEAAQGESERLKAAQADIATRVESASTRHAALEAERAAHQAAREQLDASYAAAFEVQAEAETVLNDVRTAQQKANQERAAAAARWEGLSVGLNRKDAHAALLAAAESQPGVVGTLVSALTVVPGHETAVAAALGSAADAVVVDGLAAATSALGRIKTEDWGRAGLVPRGSNAEVDRASWPSLPASACYAVDVVKADESLVPSLVRLLDRVAIVDDLAQARALIESTPQLSAVTADGDVVTTWFSSGGSQSAPSTIEIVAAIDAAAKARDIATAEVGRLAAIVPAKQEALKVAREAAQAAKAALKESDKVAAELNTQLRQLEQLMTTADAEKARYETGIGKAEQTRDDHAARLVELTERLQHAHDHAEVAEPDPSERDQLGVEETRVRQAEMEARLSLRTVEERARALAGRVDALRRAAHAERQAREKAASRREQLRREAAVAQATVTAADWLLDVVAQSSAQAQAHRTAAETARLEAEKALTDARRVARDLSREFEALVASGHQDDLARTERKLRVESLADKALEELGLSIEVLVSEFGPEVMVPGEVEGEEAVDYVPYDRTEQEKRLRSAQRVLQQLGRVNPLALEEFEALQERHGYLAEQLDDLRKTRADLVGIIEDVDARVQQVFAEAYADVEKAFASSFSRLFPGGEGRLILTEPGNWLTTGVDVEARPAGKKIKRLSLLSGGERSLVAVAFLVALFQARPSPFYILDEVEAALDDTNLGRLLGIYEELRENSQMLIITHQKRTMEVADALYGVTMREDGVTTVISQRLRDA